LILDWVWQAPFGDNSGSANAGACAERHCLYTPLLLTSPSPAAEAETSKSMAEWKVYASFRPQQADFKNPSSTDTRRHHSKSRTGCTVCKKRRINCDETKPACRQCLDYGRRCSYLDTRPQDFLSQRPRRSAKDHEAFSRRLFEHVWAKLQSRTELCHLADGSMQRANVRLLFDHFISCKDELQLDQEDYI